ncbi:ArsA family ATPase [Halosegnis sp.]|uniref:ArsA family ATPase n=1 Tax=Halosegnis sp. TaxID=2864959 RepID=UPI0035D4870F
MTEVVLYGGKGGVGKTTMAAASALQSAAAGDDTLVVSTDPAHSLGDVTKTDLGGEPTPIRDGLWGVEVDPEAGIDRYQALFETLAAELGEAGIQLDEDEVAALFSSGVVPGSDELAALDGLATYLAADRFDRVVFDTAPTGHTLRLLDLPAVMDRGLATAMDLREQVRRKVDAARTMLFGPMAAGDRETPGKFTDLRERMDRVGAALRDADRTAFHVVTLPETMAVRETERLVAQLREFDVPVASLVVNKVVEDPGDCERCRARHTVQTETLGELERALPEVPVRRVPETHGEVTGLAALERVGTQLAEQ